MMFPEKNIKSIIVFRALQLGDLLCSIPAFRALRGAYPDADITLAGMPWMQTLTKRFPNYFDNFIWFPGYPGLPEQDVDQRQTLEFLMDMNNGQFDLALQMQGNGSVVNPMIELFGAKHNAGFFRKEDYLPGEGFLEYPNGISEIHRHLQLMEHLGISLKGDDLEFPITQEDCDALCAAALPVQNKKYICVHPGSRGGWRQWAPEYFAVIAEQCQEMGYTIVLTGTEDELPIVEKVFEKMHVPPVVAAGKTNMGAMAALLERSAGLISNCTGVSHIASALQMKSVVISMDGEPERWAPLNTRLHITIDWTKNKNIQPVRQIVQQLFSVVR